MCWFARRSQTQCDACLDAGGWRRGLLSDGLFYNNCRRSEDMWTYILGPFLALLPKWWRGWLPFLDAPRWRRATILSGLAELIGAIVALSYWYMYAMSLWVDRGVDAALAGKLGPGVTTHQIAGVALSVWATHPVTWVLG